MNYYPMKYSVKDPHYVNPNKVDYHAMLYLTLQGLRDTQKHKGLVWDWSMVSQKWVIEPQIKRESKLITLKTPVLFIIGDTEGHGKLCCLVGGGGREYSMQ